MGRTATRAGTGHSHEASRCCGQRCHHYFSFWSQWEVGERKRFDWFSPTLFQKDQDKWQMYLKMKRTARTQNANRWCTRASSSPRKRFSDNSNRNFCLLWNPPALPYVVLESSLSLFKVWLAPPEDYELIKDESQAFYKVFPTASALGLTFLQHQI